MKRRSKDEDVAENPQSILKNKIKTSKQPILNANAFVKIPRKLVETLKKPIVSAKNINNLKNQEQSNRVTDSTPKKFVSDGTSIGSDSHLITPSKVNPKFCGTLHLGDFETVNMQHDLDDLLDWKHMKLQTDSILDYTSSPETILRALDYEIKLETDPLFIENENENEHKNRKSGKGLSQSPCSKSDHKSSPQKSNKKRRGSSKPEKSNKKSLSAEEIKEIEVENILEEVYHVELEEMLSSQIIDVRKLFSFHIIFCII